MQHLSIRFLIGLSKASDPGYPSDREADERAGAALGILSYTYPSLLAVRGKGYWNSAPEPTLVAEVIVPDTGEGARAKAVDVARVLAQALGQESVALAIAPVQFRLEGPYETLG